MHEAVVNLDDDWCACSVEILKSSLQSHAAGNVADAT